MAGNDLGLPSNWPLSAVEQERIDVAKVLPCQKGHSRHDAYVTRRPNGRVKLACRQCAFDSARRNNPPKSNRGRDAPTTPETFWAKVAKGRFLECWPFLGTINTDGYGRIRYRQKLHQAHRLAYAFAVYDPGKMHVLHICDNRRCCNPAHLYLGTDVENARDKVERGRTAKGSACGRAKLHERDIPSIRTRLAGGASARKIALEYGVSSTTIRHIRAGETWRHV